MYNFLIKNKLAVPATSDAKKTLNHDLANKEAEDIINSLKHFISIKGEIVRTMKNEVNLCFYSMTKY